VFSLDTHCIYEEEKLPISHCIRWVTSPGSIQKFAFTIPNSLDGYVSTHYVRRFNSPLFANLFFSIDISMPVMDGLASTRAIRAFEREKKIKPSTIIILTGLTEGNVRQEAVISGASLFLTKPVRLKQLGEILKPLEQLSD
jgi:CheY-like chemotaxis protein